MAASISNNFNVQIANPLAQSPIIHVANSSPAKPILIRQSSFQVICKLPSDALSSFASSTQSALKYIQEISSKAFSTLKEKIQSTAFSSLREKSFKIATQIEIGFNIAVCVPVLGQIFTHLRVVAGKLQVAAAAVVMIVGKSGHLIGKMTQASESELNKWKAVYKFGGEHMLHGCLNIIRGIGELIVSTLTLGLGNIILIAPNLINKEPFTPMFSYGSLIHTQTYAPVVTSEIRISQSSTEVSETINLPGKL